MSKVGTIVAIGGVSTVLFALTYVGVAAAKGVPLSTIPPFAWFAHEMPHTDPGPAAAHVAPVVATPAPRVEAPAVPPMTAGVLGAFVLPSPFDSRELQSLQKELNERRTRIEETERLLEKRARDLDDWQKNLEERMKEIDAARGGIASGSTTTAATTPSASEADAKDDPASWRAMASLFEEGDAEEMATKLASFEPDQAAQVLKGLEPERAALLLNALPTPKYKPFLDAWRKAKD